MGTVWIHKLFLFFFTIKILVIIFVSGSSQELIKNGEFQKEIYMFDAFILKPVKNVGPKMCLLACMRQSRCNAVNYHFNHLYCELLLVSTGGVLADKPGYKFSYLSAWEIPNDVCWPNPCHPFQTCVVTYNNLPVCMKSGISHVIQSNGTGCTDIKNQNPDARDGIYKTSNGFFTCDMTTDGGGWTVFQRRMDGSVDFFRDWVDYKYGFGTFNGEFWLGNERLYLLTSKWHNELRIELKDGDSSNIYAQYSSFSISDEASNYRLNLTGYSGDAGNMMAYSNRWSFTTKDRDNDGASGNCAVTKVGAWWYANCAYSNLNGKYLKGNNSKSPGSHGVHWYQVIGGYFSQSKMMIRRN